MSYYLKKEGGVYNVPIKYFECDEESDRLALDTTYLEFGTRIHVMNEDTNYVLNSSKEWKKLE